MRLARGRDEGVDDGGERHNRGACVFTSPRCFPLPPMRVERIIPTVLVSLFPPMPVQMILEEAMVDIPRRAAEEGAVGDDDKDMLSSPSQSTRSVSELLVAFREVCRGPHHIHFASITRCKRSRIRRRMWRWLGDWRPPVAQASRQSWRLRRSTNSFLPFTGDAAVPRQVRGGGARDTL